MTAQLADNRRRLESNAAELREKNCALEERRHYIETVLQTVSTGVLSLDEENRVTTINSAALAMLRLEDAPAPQTPLSEIVSAEDCGVLERIIWRARVRGRASEQIELARAGASDGNGDSSAGGHKSNVSAGASNKGENGAGGGSVIPVALTATALSPRESGVRRGVVLVIEDLSELLAAQRAAAWSEVARRLAHEIKNPLTPIQLSAERIARKFRRNTGDLSLSQVEPVISEGTETIIREVGTLKRMVDEFSKFARLPKAKPAPTSLNTVVENAIALYKDRTNGIRISEALDPEIPELSLDADQFKQVLVNLIDNAIEAI